MYFEEIAVIIYNFSTVYRVCEISINHLLYKNGNYLTVAAFEQGSGVEVVFGF